MTTVVFSGPTISAAEVRDRLPDSLAFPPARCGDVLQVLRLAPHTIVLIDGVFEQEAAVWHKELLVALHRGVRVIGAASMGALRASELDAFGMVGVGRIYRDYAGGSLVDDGAVALLHAHDGRPLTVPLVDVCATLDDAVERGIVERPFATEVEAVAAAMFHAARTFESVVGVAGERAGELHQAEALLAHVRQSGLVNQKRLDALEALDLAGVRPDEEAGHVGPEVPPTVYLRRLSRTLACSAPSLPVPPQFDDERVASASRFLGHAYGDVKRLAHLLAGLTDLAAHSSSGRARPGSDTPLEAMVAGTPDDVAERGSVIESFAREVVGVDVFSGSDHLDQLAALLRIDGLYESTRRIDASDLARGLRVLAPDRAPAIELTARLWRVFDAVVANRTFAPTTEELQRFVNRFRTERSMFDPTVLADWIQANDLTSESFVDMMRSWCCLSRTVMRGDMGPFAVEQGIDAVHWFRDALWLSSLFDRARTLAPPDIVVPSDEATALARDFRGGAYGAEVARRHLWPHAARGAGRFDLAAGSDRRDAARRLRDSFADDSHP